MPSDNQLFDTGQVPADLNRRTMHGGVAVLSVQGVRFALRVVAAVVLARLISPEDFGLFALLSTISELINRLQQAGLNAATIQKKDLAFAQVNALFWINVNLSLALSLLTLLAAPLLGWVFQQPRLPALVMVASSWFIFSALSGQHLALIKRQVRYTTVAAIDLPSLILGTTAGIIAAWLGAGIWALMIMQFMMLIVTTTGVWLTSNWRPGWPSVRGDIREMLKFGGHLTSFSLLTFLNRNVDNMMIARFAGAEALGFYDRAFQLLLLPRQQISFPLSSIMQSGLSRLQDDPRQFREYFLKNFTVIFSLSLPVIVFLFVAAEPAVLVALGPNWRPSAFLFQALAPAALVHVIMNSFWAVLVAQGKAARQVREAGILTAFNVTAIVFGIRWGTMGVALAVSAAHVVFFMLLLLLHCQPPQFDLPGLLRTLARPLLASTLAGLGLAWLQSHQSLGSLSWLVLASTLFGFLYFGAWLMFPQHRCLVLSLLRHHQIGETIAVRQP